MQKRLNEEQRKLAEDNHNLILSYLSKKHLSYDEFYDVCAIGLCIAALNYDSSLGYSFSTLAFLCMKNEVMREFRQMNLARIVPSDLIDSLDAPLSKESGDKYTLYDVIPSAGFGRDPQYESITDVISNIFALDMKPKYHEAVRLYMELGTLAKVGEQMHISRERVRQILIKVGNIYRVKYGSVDYTT